MNGSQVVNSDEIERREIPRVRNPGRRVSMVGTGTTMKKQRGRSAQTDPPRWSENDWRITLFIV